jgi:hypothetical protein
MYRLLIDLARVKDRYQVICPVPGKDIAPGGKARETTTVVLQNMLTDSPLLVPTDECVK